MIQQMYLHVITNNSFLLLKNHISHSEQIINNGFNQD
jgi:hypothetical protein